MQISIQTTKSKRSKRLSFNFLKANTTNGIAQNFSNVWIPQFTYSITHNIEQVNFNLFVKKEDSPLLNGGLDLLHPKGSNSIIAWFLLKYKKVKVSLYNIHLFHYSREL